MTVGVNILNLRKLKKMSQEELAEKMRVTRQTVSLWETDQTLPTLDNLVRLKDTDYENHSSQIEAHPLRA